MGLPNKAEKFLIYQHLNLIVCSYFSSSFCKIIIAFLFSGLGIYKISIPMTILPFLVKKSGDSVFLINPGANSL